MTKVNKRHAMTHEKASLVKTRGHAVEKEFADLIGGRVYSSAIGRKKDVVDPQDNLHSVKSGDIRWQIFLYGLLRLKNELDFQGSEILVHCLESFPSRREDYVKDKEKFKLKLGANMIKLKSFLVKSDNKRRFLLKSFFNNGEVDYLTIKENGIFHTFYNSDVIKVLDGSTYLENSMARHSGQMDAQKVVFKESSSKTTIGEIEVRHESPRHYRRMLFTMQAPKTLALLKDKLSEFKALFGGKLILHCVALSKFKET